MSDLRQAAQQALEAMEDHAKQYPHMQKGYTVDAITALRAALAEPDDPAAYNGWVLREVLFDNGEPVGHRDLPKTEPVQPAAWEFKHRDETEWKRLIPRIGQTLEAALAEIRGYTGVFRRGPLYEVRALYAHPPRREWVGLTDEERKSSREYQSLLGELGPVWSPTLLYYYIAIEAALKEKNT